MSYFIKMIFVISFAIMPTEQAIALDTSDCNYEMLSGMVNIDVTKLSAIEKPSLEEATEGGQITEYWEKDKLKKIRVNYYGENGKSEISYYPKGDNYFVELKNTYYTSPIYVSSSDIASVSEFKFIICGDKTPNYPNSSELDTEYSRAIHTLNFIK